jgi:enamine deaminase RidA (YjgF/YER057c/UK114 family)
MTDQTAPAGNGGSVRYLNPETLHANPAFSQVVVASGPVKTVYIGMQCAVDCAGQIVGRGDVGAQAEQTLRNVEACLAAAGASPEHLVTWTICLVQGQPVEPAFAAGLRWWGNRPNPPANTVMFVAGLPHPDFLIGIEAIAVVPL